MKAKIGCVILAAGKSERFGENKLNIKINGKSLYERAISCIPKDELYKTVVVSRFPDIKQKAESKGFHFIKNCRPEYGISHTIKLGLEYTQDCDATMFVVSDQPFLKKESIVNLIDFYDENRDFIVSIGHNGKRGNPCIFPKAFYEELFHLTGDNGGNAIIKSNKDKLIIFNIECKDELQDIDTKEDLKHFITEV